MRDEVATRVHAQVPRSADVLLLDGAVLGEDRLAVGRVDEPALDRELLDEQIRIPAARLEVGRLPEPPRRHADHGDEERHEDEEEAADLRVQARSRFTWFETMSS